MSELDVGQEVPAELSNRLDMVALAELQDLLEEDFVGLLQEFIDSSDRCSMELIEHIEQPDYDEFRRCAHSLKGSALNVGAPSLAARWSALEDAAVKMDPKQQLQDLLQPAQQELEQTTLALRKHFF